MKKLLNKTYQINEVHIKMSIENLNFEALDFQNEHDAVGIIIHFPLYHWPSSNERLKSFQI